MCKIIACVSFGIWLGYLRMVLSIFILRMVIRCYCQFENICYSEICIGNPWNKIQLDMTYITYRNYSNSYKLAYYYEQNNTIYYTKIQYLPKYKHIPSICLALKEKKVFRFILVATRQMIEIRWHQSQFAHVLWDIMDSWACPLRASIWLLMRSGRPIL